MLHCALTLFSALILIHSAFTLVHSSCGWAGFQVEMHESLLTSDALSTVPEGIAAVVPPNVVAMLDNEVCLTLLLSLTASLPHCLNHYVCIAASITIPLLAPKGGVGV